jgi:hypothetical protein
VCSPLGDDTRVSGVPATRMLETLVGGPSPQVYMDPKASLMPESIARERTATVLQPGQHRSARNGRHGT